MKGFSLPVFTYTIRCEETGRMFTAKGSSFVTALCLALGTKFDKLMGTYTQVS